MHYVLHMTELARWRSGDGDLDAESLHTDGFVRAFADENTVLTVANSLYGSVTEPYCVLVVDTARLACEVRWEAPSPAFAARWYDDRVEVDDSTLFPHIYGPIPREAVVGVRYLRREPPGVFTAVDQRGSTAEALDLFPHPEGGWFRSLWRSGVWSRAEGFDGDRETASALQFLLGPGERCRWHRLRSAQMWSFGRGGPAVIALGGSGPSPEEEERHTLGPHVEAGQELQVVVPAGTWQTAHPLTAQETLATCFTSPAFEFDDLEIADAGDSLRFFQAL
ncbi:cupin domain-containing protein [Nocardiopsis quinghaiensis]|uniref:cupin domain-containing protein n=1 Tax=Nocardiopsis quinghaiensis TaxID=464995 RepID=UPI001238ABB9|nr:cupin domain-containing protein [Nocardiopsis quinghaiensis]